LAYGFPTESENVDWLVYDFGGGTFDAAVMRVRDGLIQVVSHDGDNHLGGKLLDWDIVVEKLIPAITGQFHLPDFRRGNTRWRAPIGKLKYLAERTKIEVCRTQTQQEIWIAGLCDDADGKPVIIEKGAKLPIRRSVDLLSTVPLRAGHAEDVLRIAVIEGENTRATRNLGIGVLNISGTQIRRDLPVLSQIEVTIVIPCLTDFGLALKDEDFGTAAELAGTPAYMSPEQARGESHRVDGRSGYRGRSAQDVHAGCLGRQLERHLRGLQAGDQPPIPAGAP